MINIGSIARQLLRLVLRLRGRRKERPIYALAELPRNVLQTQRPYCVRQLSRRSSRRISATWLARAAVRYGFPGMQPLLLK